MGQTESLESRRLFAAVTVAAAAGGKLRITGTSGDDAVIVALYGKHQIVVQSAGVTEYFLKSEIKFISFVGGSGDDSITLGHVKARAYLDGGSGDDSLSASDGNRNDTLLGGDGDDYCYAGPGDDSLDGGNGGDFLIGNAGDDYLECKSEIATDDTISGGDGTDTVSLRTYQQGTTTTVGILEPGSQRVTDVTYGDIERFYGSDFDDRVYNSSGVGMAIDGGRGNDVIISGRGSDTIVGGQGRDSIQTAGGDDYIFVLDGERDTVLAGGGTDHVQYDTKDTLKDAEDVLGSLVEAPI